MKKNILIVIFIWATCFSSYAQEGVNRDTLSPEASRELLSTLDLDKSFLTSSSKEACNCIDSISVSGKNANKIAEEISGCIHKQVASYQMVSKLMISMKDTGKNKIVDINVNKESNEYKKYYFQLERYLRDSCSSLNDKIIINDKKSKHSVSKKQEALDHYKEGTKYMNDGEFRQALVNFTIAVKIDADFAFAWDNIGVCNRKLEKFDEAIAAYNRSLEIDPKGVLPLHNLPVVYELKEDFDKALDAYQKLLRLYPDDPEAYYGIGCVYIYDKKDLEKGLDNMCKAYNMYTAQNSPYRVDAEKDISYVFGKMKEDKKEDIFNKILKDNNINPSKN